MVGGLSIHYRRYFVYNISSLVLTRVLTLIRLWVGIVESALTQVNELVEHCLLGQFACNHNIQLPRHPTKASLSVATIRNRAFTPTGQWLPYRSGGSVTLPLLPK